MPFMISSAAEPEASACAAVFDAEVTPHDSLGVDGFAIFVKAILAALLGIEALLILRGSWVVALYAALDAGLLLLAFKHFRSRPSRERVKIGAGVVEVVRHSAGGMSHRRLRVFGLELERDDDPDYGCLSLRLRLRSERVEVARDLSPDERDRFCGLLEAALRRAGGNPRVTRNLAPPLHAAARGEA